MRDIPSPELLALQEALRGRYSLERELGRGGMGIVFLAHEVRLDRPVALKLLPPHLAAQPVLRERFLSEARTAAKLSHPHIVPIFSVDEVDDFVFFVMAYVEGETLGERVRRRGPVPHRGASRILREVSWALAYAHAQGVVHRDVKPDNILLEEGSGRALVTDFGIAHTARDSGKTTAGEVLGTAEYMSPEQASGEAVDERSDMYSLGIVGHYMLSGQVPFQADSVAATLAKQITQAAPPIASVAPEAPAYLAEALDRCLAKEPAERFADGEALAEALGRSLPARAEIPGPIRVFAERNREHSRTFWAIALYEMLCLPFAVMGALEEGAPALIVAVVWMVTVGFAMIPPGMLLHMARRLLRAGFGYEDLVLGLRKDFEQRSEAFEQAYETRSNWIDRLASGVTYLSGATIVAAFIAFAATGWSLSGPVAQALFAAGLAAVAASLPAGVIAAVRHELRGHVKGGRWLRFWESRLGRWIFKAAGLGLDRLPSAGAAFRPTEMAIGMAADRLFEELPKDLRKRFGELPAVVRTLEGDAEGMRGRIRELEAILQDVETDRRTRGTEGTSVADLAVQRSSLAAEVRQAKETAEQRLAEVVSALETIRLELLRMHAGAGSVESMTQDLSAALELSEGIGHFVQGQRAVAELLGLPVPDDAAPTPTPA